ncbi:LysR family transcriptional regulator [Sneathiella sp.]|jgi:DNA-binding transcriptional LysR family regulator|uniref:LysR family transcriptional regulator n=1 Tax=Sneathiella sp. TaxID=1964365 RepID=UPI0039E515F8
MLQIDGIQEFAMVAETESFTKAAQRLSVSTSHVSKQISALEDRLGVKLFSRSTRVVRLTEVGTAYYRKISDVLDGLEEANHSASASNTELVGRIKVAAAGPFSEEKISPLLVAFAKENPGVFIEMIFDTQFVNLVDNGFDFAIRYGTLPDNGMIARKLSGREMACAATPDFLSQYGQPNHPNALKNYPCLLINSDLWHFMDRQSGDPIDVRVSGTWKANSMVATKAAAINSLGIIYTPKTNIEKELASGALIPILEGYEDRSRSQWIVYPERRHMPLRVRKAIDYIASAFSDTATIP